MLSILFLSILSIFVILLMLTILYLFWFKKLAVCEDELPLEELEVKDMEEVKEELDDVIVFNTVKEFMRFVNNYEGEMVIKNNVLFDKDLNVRIAMYKKVEVNK